jgi:hypothetical protein
MKPHIFAVLLSAGMLAGCSDAPPPPPEAGSESGPGSYLQNVAEGQQRAVKTVDLAAVNKAVETFYVQEGRFPKELLELVERDYLPAIPELPGGAVWNYNATNGIVSIGREKL